MELTFRPATPEDHPQLERMVLAAFEPITWARRTDELFGPLNGKDWRERWRLRLAGVLATQHVLVGEVRGRVVAMATATVDPDCRLGYIELLAVDPACQGRGYGRAMLRQMLAYLKELGCEHAHLECLENNEAGNRLYRSEGFVEVAR
ncbi:MAG: GNAT family N-acetyltransferase, partial [Bryobacteraceae bacterium]|nr:GNAT family N-acetyltransferase [Bryobacteraceae bacterium]